MKSRCHLASSPLAPSLGPCPVKRVEAWYCAHVWLLYIVVIVRHNRIDGHT